MRPTFWGDDAIADPFTRTRRLLCLLGSEGSPLQPHLTQLFMGDDSFELQHPGPVSLSPDCATEAVAVAIMPTTPGRAGLRMKPYSPFGDVVIGLMDAAFGEKLLERRGKRGRRERG